MNEEKKYSKGEILELAADIFDEKQDGVLLALKATQTEDGVTLSGYSSVNNMRKSQVLEILVDAFKLEKMDLLYMAHVMSHDHHHEK